MCGQSCKVLEFGWGISNSDRVGFKMDLFEIEKAGWKTGGFGSLFPEIGNSFKSERSFAISRINHYMTANLANPGIPKRRMTKISN